MEGYNIVNTSFLPVLRIVRHLISLRNFLWAGPPVRSGCGPVRGPRRGRVRRSGRRSVGRRRGAGRSARDPRSVGRRSAIGRSRGPGPAAVDSRSWSVAPSVARSLGRSAADGRRVPTYPSSRATWRPPPARPVDGRSVGRSVKAGGRRSVRCESFFPVVCLPPAPAPCAPPARPVDGRSVGGRSVGRRGRPAARSTAGRSVGGRSVGAVGRRSAVRVGAAPAPGRPLPAAPPIYN